MPYTKHFATHTVTTARRQWTKTCVMIVTGNTKIGRHQKRLFQKQLTVYHLQNGTESGKSQKGQQGYALCAVMSVMPFTTTALTAEHQ